MTCLTQRFYCTLQNTFLKLFAFRIVSFSILVPLFFVILVLVQNFILLVFNSSFESGERELPKNNKGERKLMVKHI